MKKIIFNLIFSLFSIVSYCQDENEYIYVNSDREGNTYSYMIEKRDVFSVSLWFKTEYPVKKIKNKKGEFVKKGGGHKLVFCELYCDDRRIEMTESVLYDSKGNIVRTNDFPSTQKIIPGSIGDDMRKLICE